MSGLVLYVHPHGHVLDELVPMGAVALMNRVPGPKRGCFAWELSEADIAAASVLAMDLHWYFSIEAVGWIVAAVRRINPGLPVVLGGITASFYARYLLSAFDLDYVVQGDGEGSFEALVDALRDGRKPPPLRGVWRRDAPPPLPSQVTPAQYDANDYLTLDWFPALQQLSHEGHAEYATAPFWGRMDRYHPYLPLNRGCRFPCNGCFGSYQRDVFGPGQVDRGAESVAAVLDAAEAHPHYRFINLTAGTEDMARLSAYRSVFARKRALSAYVMHFCALPSDEDLELVLGGFERVCIDFTNPGDVPLPLRASGMTIAQAEERIFAIARALDGLPNVRMGVSFMDTDPHPFKDRLRVVDWQSVQLKENSEWALPRPNAATLDAGLPDYPVPQVERRGLSAEDRRTRQAAKATQAEGFREVSRALARYRVARALAPGLHPVLETGVLTGVSGEDLAPLPPLSPALSAFLAAFTEHYRQWSVRGLAAVAVVISAVGVSGEVVLSDTGEDLGAATLSPGLRGMTLTWTGAVPEGTVGLLVRPLLDGGDGVWLDPGAIPGLPWRVLPVPDGGGEVTVTGELTQRRAVLQLGSTEMVWSPLTDRPDTPLAPEAAAPRSRRMIADGPKNLVEAPWPDGRMPRRLVRALTLAGKRGLLGGWQAPFVAEQWLWVRSEQDGATVFVLPPGEAACAWRGARLRLVVQGAIPQAKRQAIIAVLTAIEEQEARRAAG